MLLGVEDGRPPNRNQSQAGAMAGGASGAFLGLLSGVIPAPLTFGLSVPINAGLGSIGGMIVGTAGGLICQSALGASGEVWLRFCYVITMLRTVCFCCAGCFEVEQGLAGSCDYSSCFEGYDFKVGQQLRTPFKHLLKGSRCDRKVRTCTIVTFCMTV